MERTDVLLTPELVELLHGEVSFYLATRDGELRPRGSRVLAARAAPEKNELTIFGYREALEQHLASLRENGRMALSLARPSDDTAYQLKGRYLRHRACSEVDRALVERQVAQLRRNLESIGIPIATFANWKTWPSLAITMEVEEIFNQTPGPLAGEVVA